MKQSLLCVYVLLNLSCISEVVADHPTVAFGSEASGPINTIGATPMPRGSWAIGLRTELIDIEQFSDSKLANAAEQGIEDVHSTDFLSNTSVALAYGLSENLSVSARVPWVVRSNIREAEFDDHHGEGEVHGHGNTSGLGDLLLFANYRVYSVDAFDASIQAGIKAPTGEDDAADRGERFETEFQPGSGSWDFLIGGALSKMFGRWEFHSNILYNETTESSQKTEIGNALFYNAAAVYMLSREGVDHKHSDGTFHPHFNLHAMLEINGETRWKSQVNGSIDQNSGGDIVYISPGIRCSYKKFATFIAVGIPVIQDANGLQTDVAFRVVGGVGIAF